MEFEESFGVIPLRLKDGKWEVFLILHRGGRHWGFPKGHLDKPETPKQAAIRELKEETGLSVDKILQEEPLIDKYHFRRGGKFVQKKVEYFLAEVSGDPILQPEEIIDGRWMPLKEADQVLSFKGGKTLCLKVMEILHLV